MSNITELERLNRTYKKLTGRDIPSEISSQEISIVRRAVDFAKRGDHGFVPIDRPVNREEVSSLREWDHESNK